MNSQSKAGPSRLRNPRRQLSARSGWREPPSAVPQIALARMTLTRIALALGLLAACNGADETTLMGGRPVRPAPSTEARSGGATPQRPGQQRPGPQRPGPQGSAPVSPDAPEPSGRPARRSQEPALEAGPESLGSAEPLAATPLWTCEERPCAERVSCEGCALQLRELEAGSTALGRTRVQLAVVYAPGEDGTRARLADIRLHAPPAMDLVAARATDTLTRAGKELYVDDRTGESFRQRADGSYQLLVYAFANTDPLPQGQLARLTFEQRSPAEAPHEPLRFSLVRRQQVLAPARADAALQASPYTTQLEVHP